MKYLILSVMALFLMYSCGDKPQSQPEAEASKIEIPKTDPVKSLFSDEGESSFQVLPGEDSLNYGYKSIETNYKIAFLAIHAFSDIKHYIAKYTTRTKSCTGCELQERNIKVELSAFDAPGKNELTIEKKCDDIALDAHTYRTTVYGCCGGEDHIGIYDYNNKQIIEADNKIITGSIPNSQITIYVGYDQELDEQGVLGTLHISYGSEDRYAIKIKSPPLPEEECSPYSPDITIRSDSKRDEYAASNNEYTLWSLDKMASSDQINHLTIVVSYECEKKARISPIKIPLINGKPFGKETRQQEVNLE